MYGQIIFKRCLKCCVDSFSFSLQKYVVHDLNPTCDSKNPNLTVVFFHGITFGTNDEWRETWTTRPTNNEEACICWPEKWLPEDLNNNVRILSLSYDSDIVASAHNDVIEIGKNLTQVWLQIQGVTISSIHGHIHYFSLGALRIIVQIFGNC
jgi:hypothetical protein